MLLLKSYYKVYLKIICQRWLSNTYIGYGYFKMSQTMLVLFVPTVICPKEDIFRRYYQISRRGKERKQGNTSKDHLHCIEKS